jgi:phage FluMu gp28-like protein
LNEFINIKLPEITVTSGALTKARKKFKQTAFVELNQAAIVDVMYAEGDYETYKGHRVLAVDGSKILLPNTKDVIDEFGTIKYSNGSQHKHKSIKSPSF